MWGYSVPLLVAVPADVVAPPGALAAIEKHTGEGLTELCEDWVLVTASDDSGVYYWHRPSNATQYECPWVSQLVDMN